MIFGDHSKSKLILLTIWLRISSALWKRPCAVIFNLLGEAKWTPVGPYTAHYIEGLRLLVQTWLMKPPNKWKKQRYWQSYIVGDCMPRPVLGGYPYFVN